MSELKADLIDNKRIAKNMLFLYFRMLLTLCVGLFTSRVILQALGIVDYGIYNVVGGLVAMFGFINGSMRTGTQRFLTYSLGKGDERNINLVFCTSLFIHVLVAFVVLILAETIGLWFFFEKLVIPVERSTTALWVYQCTILSTLIMIINVPYNALVIAEEHMSVFAYISIIEVLLRLFSVLMLWIGNFDKLILYAILTVLIQIVLSTYYVLYCHRHFTVSRFHFLWDKQLFLKMVRFSFWSFNGSLALVCCTQGLNVLLNIFFGPAVNAARGVAVTVQSKVMLFCSNFQAAFNPQITKCYASGEMNRMHRLVVINSKFSYYLLFLISLPIIVNISALLDLWLDTVPEYTGEFAIIMIVTSMIRALANPLLTSIHATGNIKRFQMWEGTILLFVLPVAYLLLKYINISVIWVMMIYLLGEVIAQVIRILIILPMIEMKIRSYVHKVLQPIIFTTIPAAMLPFIVRQFFFPEISLLSCIMLVLLSLISVCTFSFFVGCEKEEKHFITQYMVNFFFKKDHV